MAKFRRKPVVIEAVQFSRSMDPLPEGVCVKFPCIATMNGRGVYDEQFFIQSPLGAMQVSNGDWIITGVKGEKYPCKPDIFKETYEPVD